MIGRRIWGKKGAVPDNTGPNSPDALSEAAGSEIDVAGEPEKTLPPEAAVNGDNPESAENVMSENSENPVAESAADDAKVELELVERLKAEAEESYDKYLRAVAELENIKKRHLKERSELIKYAGEHLARDILEVLDNLQLAAARPVGEQGGGDIVKGIQLIVDQFTSILERHSIKAESCISKPFDPQKQEAVSAVPTRDHPPGTVIEEFKRAYFFKDKLIRPGQVVVASAPTSTGESGE